MQMGGVVESVELLWMCWPLVLSDTFMLGEYSLTSGTKELTQIAYDTWNEKECTLSGFCASSFQAAKKQIGRDASWNESVFQIADRIINDSSRYKLFNLFTAAITFVGTYL